MFLFKRQGYFYLEYFDVLENRKRRISTRTRLKAEALKFLTKFREELTSNNKIPFTSPDDFQTEYSKYLEQTRSKLYLADVKTTFKALLAFSGNIPLVKLNSKLLEGFLLKSFNKAKYGAKHHYNNLRSAFNKAINWGYLTENPLSNVRLPKIPHLFPAFITKDELDKIINNTHNKDLQDFFLMSFHTGMRRDEIRLLKWTSMNLKERVITITNNESLTTKSKKERVVPINNTLFTMLKNRFPKVVSLNQDEFVFHKIPGIPYHQDYVTKQFKKVVRELDMSDKIHLHSLRHFTITLVETLIILFLC